MGEIRQQGDELKNLETGKIGSKTYDESPATVTRPEKEMRYVSLHHHSTYSYLDGYGLPRSHVHRAAELGMPALALTEHGNVSSHAKLEKEAMVYGIHAIYGCELYTGSVGDERTQRKNHLTVLAATQEGYRNLLRVCSQGWSDFYYEPTVSGQTLALHRTGLIILSGCTGSLLATSLVGGKNIAPEDASYIRARNVARRFKACFGDSYYLEVQMFPELEKVRIINQALERIGQELGIPLVATGDCHYTKPEEGELQQVLHSIGRAKSLEDLARNWGYDIPLSPPLDDKMAYEKLRATGLSHMSALAAIDATGTIAQRCQAQIPSMTAMRYPTPPGFSDNNEVWRAWLKEGWKFRDIDGRYRDQRKVYVDRLNYERKLIESKDFIDYFLFTSDIVKFAKDSGIAVGPARGSAAASLVCYLLRITEVNPMLFDNLLFERFIDTNRDDLPDIDLDFDDERRHEVFEYAERKYGRAYVGRIGAFDKFKSKNSLDDVARVFGIPKARVAEVKEVLLERSSGDLRASATVEDTVEQFDQARQVFEDFPDLWVASRLEGNVKSMSIHAAGLVVASEPIVDVCAIYKRTDNKGEIRVDELGNQMEVISWDKYDAESHNLLKMDILGLANMGLIGRALRHIGTMTLQDLYDLPLDDAETLQGFKENDVIGIFQFDGWATRSVNDSLRAESFDEIADVNALSRPGPLHSNATAHYTDIKKGNAEVQLHHPLLDPIVKNTKGQIVYQEQILRIVREIGKFDWTQAAYIRRIISRKIGEQEFNRKWSEFRDGAVSQGMDEETAKQIWGACITAGSYAFNAAHSVGYGMIAYWTMYLKRHHPQAFYAAALTKLSKEKQMSLMRDAERHGLTLLAPDIAESEVDWKPYGKDGVLAGFRQLPDIGPKLAPLLMEYRDLGNIETWDGLREVLGVGPKTISKIYNFVGEEDPFEIHKLEERINKVKKDIASGSLRTRHRQRLPYPSHTTEEVPGERGKDLEVVWIGTIHNRNVRDLFELNNARGTPLTPEEVKRPDLREWVIMHGEDHTDQMSVTVDRYKYPKFKEMVWSLELDHDLVLVRGVKKGYQARRALYVWDMWVIDPDD